MQYYKIWLDEYDKKKIEILGKFREYKQSINKIEEKIDAFMPVKKCESDMNAGMCFIDGGEGIRELLGSAIYFIRASGFYFNEKKFLRSLDIGVMDYDTKTKERVEFLRSSMEFETAKKCIIEFEPEYVFLDGSLYVNWSKIIESREENKEYEVFKKSFIELLSMCKKNKIHLIGVSEDSESRMFIKYLKSKYDIEIPHFMTDAGLLRMITENEFRTVEFTPKHAASTAQPNPEMIFDNWEAETEETQVKEYTFKTVYIQPKNANPLRIDVPSWETKTDEIISIIMELSKGSGSFGYPIPLYLVHLDAKIDKKISDWSAMQIINLIHKEDSELYNAILKEKRRNLRPYRLD